MSVKINFKVNRIKFCSLFSTSSLASTGGCTELCEVQNPRKRTEPKFFLKTIESDKSSFKGVYVRGDKFLHSQMSLSFPVGCDKFILGGD